MDKTNLYFFRAKAQKRLSEAREVFLTIQPFPSPFPHQIPLIIKPCEGMRGKGRKKEHRRNMTE